ncbi:MAG: hypothetical protein JW757_09765 [Anaerolineales bacterium]|nr:hypothetical protein [Anaerolineales bacterium]
MGESKPSHLFSFARRTSLFLLSIATLIFEINLSRIFSVTQFYHFAFMIVSLALLGFGASGTLLAIFPRAGRRKPAQSLGTISLAAALSISGAYILVNQVPFDSFSIAWDQRQVGIFALHYLVLALPFFFSGMAVGLLLEIFPNSAGTVYATNLIGSAAGCLAALAAPQFLGGEGTLVLSSGIAALGGLVSLLTALEKSFVDKLVVILTGMVLIFTCFGLWHQVYFGSPLPAFELEISPYKGLSYALQYPGAETISQQWNAFSRVDLISSPGIRSLPGISYRYTAPPPAEYGLLVDGDNLNPVVLPDAELSFTGYFLESVAYQLRPDAGVLLLEPGGGLDLLTALNQGAQQVTAVEPNPIIIEQVYIYSLPGVQQVQETGRSYLRRSKQSYDVVILSLTEGYHPVRSGAYSLSEDYSHTVEAYQDALERLDEDGILVIRSWLQIPPSEFLRSFVLAVTALEHNGLDPQEHIAAIRSYNAGLLIIKNRPFSPEELETVRTFSAERAFDLVYLPGIRPDEVNRYNILSEPLYYQAFSAFLHATERQAWLKAYQYEVSPPTDNHPFFGHYFKWSQAPAIIAELGKSWQPFGGAGYFVLLVLLGFAVVMAGLIILLPLGFVRRSAVAPKTRVTSFAYFGSIGLAFLLVEIPLVQHLILYLGHPAYALTTALFSILLFSGIGSLNSRRFSQRNAIAALILLILIAPWLLNTIFDATLGFSLFIRGTIAVATLAPLGFLMGIPFPSGITKMESSAPDLIPWVWGVNGAFSVISSILAALIALSVGFSWSLLAGAACYTGAWQAAKHLGGQR